MKALKVLLVDDHVGFLTAAIRHLHKQPWLEVIGTAHNGLEAMTQAEALHPDVIVMDLSMPEMGGLQATRLIRAQDRQVCIVIASHFDDAEHREHAMRAGANHFVSKLSYLQDVLTILQHTYQEKTA